jgi:ribonuclease VapC
MSVVNVGEVFYKIARERGEVVANETLEWLESLPVRFVRADRDMAVNAARIKANYPLAYADCFAAALAGGLGAAVVTGDPEFAQLERDNVVQIEWLLRPRARR